MARRPRAAQTAFGPMVIVAAEQLQPPDRRLVVDELAIRMLPPAMRVMVGACRWRVARDLLVWTTERQAAGLWAGMLCRKRYADDRVAEAVAGGIRQVVLLGAGLDTRACRLVAPAGARAFEVDLPANVAYKRHVVGAIYGQVPEPVALVPIDFETGSLGDTLAEAGLRIAEPAMFVWEAVTQYLTEPAVRRVLEFLSGAAAGSRLIFTYVRRDFLDGACLYGAERLRRQFVTGHRVWRFGLDPDDVGGLLGEHGWTEREQADAAEFTTRYVAPTGRTMPVSELERFVSAEKP
jgi:methyltransferase (TIGR00027 family)